MSCGVTYNRRYCLRASGTLALLSSLINVLFQEERSASTTKALENQAAVWLRAGDKRATLGQELRGVDGTENTQRKEERGTRRAASKRQRTSAHMYNSAPVSSAKEEAAGRPSPRQHVMRLLACPRPATMQPLDLSFCGAC